MRRVWGSKLLAPKLLASSKTESGRGEPQRNSKWTGKSAITG
jgi:hypothetical protein